MDYRNPLKKMRRGADNFDYEAYVRDRKAGRIQQAEAMQETIREGLMRRGATTQAPMPSPEDAQQELGQMAERFIQLRRRRSGGGMAAGLAAGIDRAVKSVVEERPVDTADKSGIMVKPKLKPYEIPSDDNRDSFVDALIQSESSGDYGAEITTKDGRKFVGAGQFGEARLEDFMKATGTKFTQDDFQKDPALQKEVMAWHIHSIDKAISETPGADKLDRNGLRGVAHLGGISGMKKFVKSGGEYNPSDELGTSLQKYYNKFKG